LDAGNRRRIAPFTARTSSTLRLKWRRSIREFQIPFTFRRRRNFEGSQPCAFEQAAFKFKALDPSKHGIGIAFYIEPSWSRIHKVAGEKVTEYELELKLIVQKNFLDNRLVWATNLTLEPEWEREDDGTDPKHAKLKPIRKYRLTPGKAGIYQDGAIHSIDYPDEARFIRVTGTNLEKIDRIKIDLKTGAVEKMYAQQAT
jgi:hypothetical protein